MNELIDPSTGTKLTPSFHGEECLGNGECPGYECCCDECDYYLTCFPEFDPEVNALIADYEAAEANGTALAPSAAFNQKMALLIQETFSEQ